MPYCLGMFGFFKKQPKAQPLYSIETLATQSRLVNNDLVSRLDGEQEWGAQSIRVFYKALDLPVPQKYEWYMTRDHGALALLNQIGCTIRTTQDNEYPHAKHPNYIQPLLSRTQDNWRMDLNPGLILKKNQRINANLIEYNLQLTGLDVKSYEIHANNIAYVPGHEDFPIFIDPGVLEFSGIFNGDDVEMDGPQEWVYGPLKQAFAKAWPEGQSTPGKKDLQSAFNLCADFLRRGTLVTAWSDKSNNYWGTHYAAAMYAERLRKEGTFSYLQP